MDIRNLSYAEVVKAGEEVVQELGADFMYEPIQTEYGSQCVYVHEGAPSCAVGRILFKLGVPLEVLEAMDKAEKVDMPDEPDDVLIPEYTFAGAARLVLRGFVPDLESFAYLESFQNAQDHGAPYGAAHAEAVDEAAGWAE